MAYLHQAYQDPLRVLIAQESRTCKGCAHQQTLSILGERRVYCDLKRSHGTRCKYYKETQ